MNVTLTILLWATAAACAIYGLMRLDWHLLAVAVLCVVASEVVIAG